MRMYLCAVVGGFLAVFGFLVIATLCYTSHISGDAFLNTYEYYFHKFDPATLTSPQKKLIQQLINQHAITTYDTAISNISGLYQTLITYLIGLNAIIGFVAVMYIKVISTAKAEEMVEKKFEVFVADSAKFQKTVDTKVIETIAPHLESFEELANEVADTQKEILDNYKKLNDLREKLEKKIAKLDTEENTQDVQITPENTDGNNP